MTQLEGIMKINLDHHDTAALLEPVTPVSKRFISTLTLANLGLHTGLFGVMGVFLPQQVEAIVPMHKEVMLAWASGLGALAALFANPIVGALSDRTTSRFGRRHGWTLGCAFFGALALASLGFQQTMAGVILLWCLASSCLYGVLASLSAEVPDHVPVKQRAIIGAWLGVTPAIGTILGATISSAFANRLEGYWMLSVALFLCSLLFVSTTRDAVLPAQAVRRFSWSEFLSGFWISPLKHPDFAWAWITRFLMQLGSAMFSLYLLYFLRDEMGYEQMFPGSRSEDGLVFLIIIYTGCAVIAGLICGFFSDRSGRRKIFVIASGLVQAVGMATLAFVHPSWPVATTVAAIIGLGYGCYISVDQALITQVLPSAGDRGKDLGIINLAIAGPFALAPVLAGVLVTQFGYTVLYAAAGLIAGLSAILVSKIRSVA
jgi:MFS family permease